MSRALRIFVAATATLAGISVPPTFPASAAVEPTYAWRAELFDFAETGYHFEGGSIEVADVTGDGRRDIVAGLNEGSLQFVGVLPGLAGGGFGDVMLTPVANPEAGGTWMKVVTADLDDDGDIDVAAQGGSGLDLLFQKPDGTLGNHRLLAYYGALPADWDADGDIDLITQRAIEGGVVLSLLTRQGDGSWSGVDLTNEPENNSDMILAYVNGDDRIDIVTATDPGIAVHKHLMGGDVNTTIVDPTYSALLEAGDVNGDGLTDLVRSSNHTYLLAGNGDLTFDPAVQISVDGGEFSLGDLNGDDRLDLLHAGGFAATLQRSDGSFAPPCIEWFIDGAYDRPPTIADANGDSRADVLLPIRTGAFQALFGAAKGEGWFANLEPFTGDLPVGYTIAPSFDFVAIGTCPVGGSLGQTLQLVRSLDGGPEEVVDTIVTADPEQQLTDTLPSPGEFTYLIRWAGDATHAATDSPSWTVTALSTGNELRFTHLKDSSSYGQSETFTITLGPVATTDNYSIDIYAKPEDREEYYVETLTVDPVTGTTEGTSPVFTRDTLLRARWAGDGSWDPIIVTKRIQVHVVLDGRMFRFHHREGSTFVYRRGVDPVFAAYVNPKNAGESMIVSVERRVRGSWREYLRGRATIRRGAIAIGIPHQYLDTNERYRVNATHWGEGDFLQGDSTRWYTFIVD